MNIYKLSQDINDNYDTFDSAIVIADTEDKAREINPASGKWYAECDGEWVAYNKISLIKVELIGTAIEGSKEGVVVASFNAG
ncbi:MAG: hypothetical protein ACJA0H_002338 [Francisellaceae bacterium]|jgi:hypothetical protein